MRTPLLACVPLSVLVLACACDSPPLLDASPDDGGPPGADAGPVDAAPFDAGSDEGSGDGGGPTDGGPTDGGPNDGGPTDGGPVDGGPPVCDPTTITLEAFHERLADGICALYARCATYTSSPSGACHDDYRELLVPPNIAELTLKPDAACGCLEALSRPTCELLRSVLACTSLYERATSPTECTAQSGCGGGQYCDRTPGVCPGTCRDAPALGQACDGPCDGRASCVGGVCVAPRQIGDACSNRAGERCLPEHTCVPTGGPNGAGVCRGPASAGDLCGGGAYCEAGLVCSDRVCVVGAAAGESCSGGGECALGHYCLDDVCVRSLLPGSSCAIDEECPDGFICNGVCEALPRLGEACPDGLCFAGTCADGTCELIPTGGACDRRRVIYEQCEEGSCDGDSMCAPLALQGEPCPFGVRCADGLECDSGSCVPACVL